MPHRALITGLPGFVGGFLAEHLLDCGDDVLGCSPDGAWELSSPEELRDRVELLAWDLGNEAGIPTKQRQMIENFRPDGIFHLAGLSVPGDCGQDDIAPQARAINVDGTRRVMELAAELPSRPRVLFVSSSHVYAPVTAEMSVVDESAPLGPRHGYGLSKLAAEAEVRRAIDQLGCDAVVARSFQHTGPRQNPRMMLPQWARQFAVDGSDPVEVHTRDAIIDLTDVRDVVRAYRLLIERGQRGEVYNVGSGMATRSGDVLDALRNLADPQRPIIELHPGRKQDPIANIDRLVQRTGWQPTVPIETTIADTLSWWRK